MQPVAKLSDNRLLTRAAQQNHTVSDLLPRALGDSPLDQVLMGKRMRLKSRVSVHIREIKVETWKNWPEWGSIPPKLQFSLG